MYALWLWIRDHPSCALRLHLLCNPRDTLHTCCSSLHVLTLTPPLEQYSHPPFCHLCNWKSPILSSRLDTSFGPSPAGRSPHLPDCPPLNYHFDLSLFVIVVKCQTRNTTRAASGHHSPQSLRPSAMAGARWSEIFTISPFPKLHLLCISFIPQTIASMFLFYPLCPTQLGVRIHRGLRASSWKINPASKWSLSGSGLTPSSHQALLPPSAHSFVHLASAYCLFDILYLINIGCPWGHAIKWSDASCPHGPTIMSPCDRKSPIESLFTVPIIMWVFFFFLQ